MSDLQEALDNWMQGSGATTARQKRLVLEAAKRWAAAQEAITNEGPQPRFHQKVMKRHQKEWPTLWAALNIREDDNAPTT